ncbi:GTPase domain-containing protein [Gracilibacillus salinarum]|uniref:GTPase domain-containing protein n=1 Tax=Gracilibacillus salinarum TaxID=2932255 RepID=A0ABY4GJA9_9BACI|nr:GTPase domain-containing protein [Gracilibacillus salinarum]UOQ84448.1 GTPase domain-containing protein [Gracilibacillus salinarum]
MTMEEQLISKSYYHTFTEGIQNVEPIKVLSELYIAEQQSEMPDVSYIRFAQGEVYYLYQDFEAAVFKWENVSNELKPWAQKNIADAHAKMNLLAISEDIYNAVETDSEVLQTEVLLQLFSLYIQLDNCAKAVATIKQAVDLNPDYPDVTEMARLFFEEQQDWDNAVALAINEAKRTESLSWFAVLEAYVDQGHTVNMNPSDFSDVLGLLYTLDQVHFESLSLALWNSYKQQDFYFAWLEEINNILLSADPEHSYVWNKLSNQFKVTYFELTNGNYLINEFSYLIPSHLMNWMKVSTASDAALAASAVLAWSEIYPADIEAAAVDHAESLLSQSARYPNAIHDSVKLFDSIIKWSVNEGMVLDKRYKWMVDELTNVNQYHLMLTGTEVSGQSSFVNTVLNDDLSDDATNATVLYKDADTAKIHAITHDEETNIAEHHEFKEATNNPEAFISCEIPVSFLNENRLTLIDAPRLTDSDIFRSKSNHYLHVADGLLFVLNGDSNLTGHELNKAVKIKDQVPDMPIHFLLCEMERNPNSEEAVERTEKIIARIQAYFPNARTFIFSANDHRKTQVDEFSAFVSSIKNDHRLEEERTAKILYYIKRSIEFLLVKREEVENSLMDNITWNEEKVTKLKGTKNQLADIEDNSVQSIKSSYNTIIQKWRQDLTKELPVLIQQSAEVIKDDSDLGSIHTELNDTINKRINQYIDDEVLPDLYRELQDWITDSERELDESRTYLSEMSESFNELFGEEKIYFECDSRVLDDWHRDIDRMTRKNIQLTNATFITNLNISPFLWKSAGKLVGALAKNKEAIHHKYKQFVEGKDYSKTVEGIIDEFLQQFEIFGKSLERDINMFFTDSYKELNETLSETYNEIEENKSSLGEMRERPELYLNPITLFEMKLRQYEWMTAADQRIYENH